MSGLMSSGHRLRFCSHSNVFQVPLVCSWQTSFQLWLVCSWQHTSFQLWLVCSWFLPGPTGLFIINLDILPALICSWQHSSFQLWFVHHKNNPSTSSSSVSFMTNFDIFPAPTGLFITNRHPSSSDWFVHDKQTSLQLWPICSWQTDVLAALICSWQTDVLAALTDLFMTDSVLAALIDLFMTDRRPCSSDWFVHDRQTSLQIDLFMTDRRPSSSDWFVHDNSHPYSQVTEEWLTGIGPWSSPSSPYPHKHLIHRWTIWPGQTPAVSTGFLPTQGVPCRQENHWCWLQVIAWRCPVLVTSGVSTVEQDAGY